MIAKNEPTPVVVKPSDMNQKAKLCKLAGVMTIVLLFIVVKMIGVDLERPGLFWAWSMRIGVAAGITMVLAGSTMTWWQRAE